MKDPVTPSTAELVFERDGYACVAPRLGATDPCLDRWGRPVVEGRWPGGQPRQALTLHHVKDFLMMGKRAPSDPAHLLTLCWGHHMNGWATSHMPEAREYLRGFEP